MSRSEFIDHYVCTFLATYAATHYEEACAQGEHDRLEKHHAAEDALHLAEVAWLKMEGLTGLPLGGDLNDE